MSDENLTIFVGNLSEQVDEEILYELFVQAGPLKEVRIPMSNGVRRQYGFVVFKHEVSVPYALHLMDNTKLFDRTLKLNSRSRCLHLFQPPCIARGRPRDMRGLPGQGANNMRNRLGSSMNDSSALRSIGGGLGKRFADKSMMPSGPGKSQKASRQDSPPKDRWGKSWGPKSYPSQQGMRDDLSDMIENGPSKNKNRHNRGFSHDMRKPHEKTPYFNEKHNNRDKNRFDAHHSQRQRHNRPFTR